MNEEPQAIPLQSAVLCINCEMITNSARRCNKCGSSAIHRVSTLLERRTVVLASSFPVVVVDEIEKEISNSCDYVVKGP